METLALIALIPPALYAAANHIDKYLISRVFGEEGGIGSLLIFSSIFGTITLPIAYAIDPSLIGIGSTLIAVLIVSGVVWVGALFMYFKALFTDETSFVAPFLQLIPAFGFLLGYLILGEVLASTQILGGIIILIGAAALAFRQGEEGLRLNGKVVVLMVGASILFASNDTLFKYVGLDVGFWAALFWQYVGMALVAVGFYLVPQYRKDFLHVLRQRKAAALNLNLLNEAVVLAGDVILSFALFLAPIALIETMSATQPLFIFLYGVGLAVFFPHIADESLKKKDLAQKGVAILIMLAGGILLAL